MYDTKILYVDGDNKKILVRNESGEKYVPYHYLVGCDGIRSPARAAILQRHRDFEMSINDIFVQFKAVHIALPEGFDPNSMHILPSGLPNMNGIALPETGGLVNFSFGHYHNNTLDDALMSEDPKVVAEYMKKTFKIFKLADYDDFANQWVNANWSTTGQVHCNFYHSSKMNILLLGDAAHATSPSIGMGMNTALADSAALDRLLDEHKDDFVSVLPAYSEERVKEGNALVDLAYYLYPHAMRLGIWVNLKMLVREFFAKKLPWFVARDPQALIGRKGYLLADVFNHANKLGTLEAARASNDKIRREYFQKKVGMVTEVKKSWLPFVGMVTAAAGAAVAAAAYSV